MQAMERGKCFQSVVSLKKIKHFENQSVWWLQTLMVRRMLYKKLLKCLVSIKKVCTFAPLSRRNKGV